MKIRPLRCPRPACAAKWRARDMHDVFCRKCGTPGERDEQLIKAQRKFDANEHKLIEPTGQPRGRRPVQ